MGGSIEAFVGVQKLTSRNFIFKIDHCRKYRGSMPPLVAKPPVLVYKASAYFPPWSFEDIRINCRKISAI